ncbi:hypothetical protein QFC21_001161 [Naganishia friedmannii]|uniref:Uncharacterized protein n=1 Tax=Naganishia friedmannii TaxID=89922 RepID=A0ACC2W9G4_9TREE|nr:hypothetical protein QFC21_001161 [Naganishia friedmannii]
MTLGQGKVTYETPVGPKTYRTLATQSLTPYARPDSLASSRLRRRPFLDPSSPLYESPYRSRQQQRLSSSASSKSRFAKPDSSSPLVEKKRYRQPPRLDIANPLYTLRPHGETGSDQAPWMLRRKTRSSKTLKESGL